MTTQEFDSARAVEAAHELMRVSRAMERVEWADVRREAEEAGEEADSGDEKTMLSVRMFSVLLEFLSRFDPTFDPHNTPYFTLHGLADGERLLFDGPGRRNLPPTDLATYLQQGSEGSKGLGKGSTYLQQDSEGPSGSTGLGNGSRGLGKGSNGLDTGSKGLGKGNKGLGKTPSSGTDWSWASLAGAYGVETHWAHGGFAYRSY